MELTVEKLSTAAMRARFNIRVWVSQVPLLGWLLGVLVAVVLDDTAATPLLHEALFALDIPLTVGVIAGTVFWYYLSDLGVDEKEAKQ